MLLPILASPLGADRKHAATVEPSSNAFERHLTMVALKDVAAADLLAAADDNLVAHATRVLHTDGALGVFSICLLAAR